MARTEVAIRCEFTEVVSDSTGNLVVLVEGYVDGKLAMVFVVDPRLCDPHSPEDAEPDGEWAEA